jgi:hypothetical protein
MYLRKTTRRRIYLFGALAAATILLVPKLELAKLPKITAQSSGNSASNVAG